MNDINLTTLPPPVLVDANKYTRGSLMVLAGSTRYPGAAVLVAKAAARTGAGYVTLAIPENAAPVAQGHMLSIPVIAAPAQDGAFAADAWEHIAGQVSHMDAIVLGPGITVSPSTSEFVQSVFVGSQVPMLLDADALNVFAAFCAIDNQPPTWFLEKPGGPLSAEKNAQNLILTPHGGELKRLFEATQTSKLEVLARVLNCIIVAKGPTTQIVSATKTYTSATGTAALATAGTGDVLSGIIGSLLAQGATPFDASVLGVEIHSRAGKIAEQRLGRRSVCAEDVIKAIPTVIQELDKV